MNGVISNTTNSATYFVNKVKQGNLHLKLFTSRILSVQSIRNCRHTQTSNVLSRSRLD